MNLYAVEHTDTGPTLPGVGLVMPARVRDLAQIRRIGFRPDEIVVSQTGTHRFDMRVSVVERLGTQILLHGHPDTMPGKTGQRPIVAVVPSDMRAAAGDIVPFSIPTDALYAFDAQGRALSAERAR